MKLSSYYDILKYIDYSDLDVNLSKTYLNGSYNSSDLTSSTFSYSNVEGQSAKSELSLADTPALVETSTETATFFTSYRYSPKLSLSLGINQSELTYDTYSDQLSSKKIHNNSF